MFGVGDQKGSNKVKEVLPLVALRDVVVFPHTVTPLLLKRKKSLSALEAAMSAGRLAFFVAQKEKKKENPKPNDLYRMGCVAKIRETDKQPDGAVRILVEGVIKAEVKEYIEGTPYFKVRVVPKIERSSEVTEKVEALMQGIISQFKQAIALGATVPIDVLLAVVNIKEPLELADLIILNLDFSTEDRQAVLEADSVGEKLERVNKGLGRQIKILKMAKKLQTDTQQELGKMQKEIYLREQLKSIEKELGIAGGKSEIHETKEKIDKAGMPKEVREKALKELYRLEGMPSFSPEVSYVKTYLDWMVSLPWSKKSDSKINIKQAQKILDEDHYGLEKVKERIVEYLAVQKLVGKIKGPILCFVGPPGTGKTSIGKSIARSLDRKFVRISLGGIRDEAEIRGHRRTYVGALPGRIIQGINDAGTKNPVFMLDEIDKIGADFRGDPSSALLEALDPEQNNSFSDHYLESPFDLSDVMFITTANLLDTVPPALRDRMEVIEFPGYTEDEKYHIAEGYLIPKQIRDNGLLPMLKKGEEYDDLKKLRTVVKKKANLIITPSATKEIIRYYTKEAGVRNLEREISKICRKVAKKISENGRKKFEVGVSDVKKYLGAIKYRLLGTENKDEVGITTGLAWTQVGGEVLLIEATIMPGDDKLILTGNMGKVMQESVRAAFSYAKSKAKKLGITPDDFKKKDIHVHVPSGAIPKDGPSAGIAMTISLISVLTKRPVKHKVAMTGEITLRGRVMEIGGVKEKILAAHRAGIDTVILPKDNEKDLEDIPDNVRKKLKFVYADTMEDVIKVALK